MQAIAGAGRRRAWLRSVGEAVRDSAGVMRRMEGAVRDISEPRREQHETGHLAEHLTATPESITAAFFTLDRDWRFTFLNSDAARRPQRPRAELRERVSPGTGGKPDARL